MPKSARRSAAAWRGSHAVDLETDGATAHGLLRVERFDLVVLDANLPGMDGFTVLRHLRASGSTTPVLLVTARSAIDDRVSGSASAPTTTW